MHFMKHRVWCIINEKCWAPHYKVNVSGVNGAKQQQQQQPRMHTLPAAVAPVGIGLI